jgi:Ca-activated chloride channel homolog
MPEAGVLKKEGTQPVTHNNLTITAGLDRRLVRRKGASIRYVVVRATPPEAPAHPSRPSASMNIAIVIDASGSMSGGKLEAAQDAAAGVVEQLTASDRLTIVSFASDVVVHVDALLLDRKGKSQALAAIASLCTRGSTNLSGGWTAGAKSVALAMAGGARLRNHVVLLTDGMANEGVIDPSVLRERASALFERGITSSAVGIGEDYSSDQIEAIGTAGGGGFDHANSPAEIIEIVLGHLKAMGSVTAENVRLRLALPSGATANCLNRFPTKALADGLEVALGGIPAGATRTVVFRVVMPAGDAGRTLPLKVSANWNRPGEAEPVAVDGELLEVTFARGADVDRQSRDVPLSLEAAHAWQAEILLRTAVLNREHRYDEAEEFVDEQLRYFRPYCDGLEGGPALVARVERLRRNARRDWGRMAEREVSAVASRISRSEGLYRKSARMAVAEDFLPED